VTSSYDAIVLGTGGVGSAALFHLARRGLRVLGIDRFGPGHDRGSSHGETRIIRQAYFEHPDYVPLLLRAYELWAELEELTGEKLFHKVGLLQVGPRDGAVVSGVLKSARQHGLTVEELTASQTERRFPGFVVPSELTGVFELQAGYLLVENCVLAHLQAAKKHGAEHLPQTTVISWRAEGGGVVVTTDRGEFRAGRLVMSPGAWAGDLLGSLDVRLEVRRKHVYWFSPTSPEYASASGCPTFLYELPHGVFYGFPSLPTSGLKAAEHSGGEVVSNPSSDPRVFDRRDCERVRSFLAGYLPGVAGQVVRHSVCFYTMTADEHFLIDRHPAHPNVVFAAGLSGHGFKFTGVLGEALVDLAMHGETRLPVDFLRLSRLSSMPQMPRERFN
jgi:monomeric sarcosine oxidase